MFTYSYFLIIKVNSGCASNNTKQKMISLTNSTSLNSEILVVSLAKDWIVSNIFFFIQLYITAASADLDSRLIFCFLFQFLHCFFSFYAILFIISSTFFPGLPTCFFPYILIPLPFFIVLSGPIIYVDKHVQLFFLYYLIDVVSDLFVSATVSSWFSCYFY